jgi:AcrR family transcriptional regulator
MKAGQRREAILTSSAQVFARQGYEGAGTADLAAACGVSEPVIYRHFSGKEDLFCSVLDWAAEQILADWHKTVSGIDRVRDRILALSTIHPHVLSGDGSAYRVLQIAQASTAYPGVRLALISAFGQFEEFLSDLVRSGQLQGELRGDIDPQDAAWTLLSLGLAFRLTRELELPVATSQGWVFGAGSRYLDTMTKVSND